MDYDQEIKEIQAQIEKDRNAYLELLQTGKLKGCIYPYDVRSSLVVLGDQLEYKLREQYMTAFEAHVELEGGWTMALTLGLSDDVQVTNKLSQRLERALGELAKLEQLVWMTKVEQEECE